MRIIWILIAVLYLSNGSAQTNKLVGVTLLNGDTTVIPLKVIDKIVTYRSWTEIKSYDPGYNLQIQESFFELSDQNCGHFIELQPKRGNSFLIVKDNISRVVRNKRSGTADVFIGTNNEERVMTTSTISEIFDDLTECAFGSSSGEKYLSSAILAGDILTMRILDEELGVFVQDIQVDFSFIDNQNLSLSGDTLSIDGGNEIILPISNSLLWSESNQPGGNWIHSNGSPVSITNDSPFSFGDFVVGDVDSNGNTTISTLNESSTNYSEMIIASSGNSMMTLRSYGSLSGGNWNGKSLSGSTFINGGNNLRIGSTIDMYFAAGPGELKPAFGISSGNLFRDGQDETATVGQVLGNNNGILDWVTIVTGSAIEWDSLVNVPAGFSDGIDNVDDADSDSSNEIQVLSADIINNGSLDAFRVSHTLDANSARLYESYGTDILMDGIFPSIRTDTSVIASKVWVNANFNIGSPDWNNLINVPAGFSDGIDNVDDADSDSSNEIQVLSADIINNGSLDAFRVSHTLDANSARLYESYGTDILMDGIFPSIRTDTSVIASKVWVNNQGFGDAPLWDNIIGIPAGFSDGIDNVDDADASTTNEIQSLSSDVVINVGVATFNVNQSLDPGVASLTEDYGIEIFSDGTPKIRVDTTLIASRLWVLSEGFDVKNNWGNITNEEATWNEDNRLFIEKDNIDNAYNLPVTWSGKDGDVLTLMNKSSVQKDVTGTIDAAPATTITLLVGETAQFVWDSGGSTWWVR